MQDAMGILGLLGPRGEAALAVFEHLSWKVFGPALAGVGNGRTSVRAQTVRVYSTDKQSNSELFLKFLALALLALMGWRQSRNNQAVLPCFFFWELSAKKKSIADSLEGFTILAVITGWTGSDVSLLTLPCQCLSLCPWGQPQRSPRVSWPAF